MSSKNKFSNFFKERQWITGIFTLCFVFKILIVDQWYFLFFRNHCKLIIALFRLIRRCFFQFVLLFFLYFFLRTLLLFSNFLLPNYRLFYSLCFSFTLLVYSDPFLFQIVDLVSIALIFSPLQFRNNERDDMVKIKHIPETIIFIVVPVGCDNFL